MCGCLNEESINCINKHNNIVIGQQIKKSVFVSQNVSDVIDCDDLWCERDS